jgi:hypothetical protein
MLPSATESVRRNETPRSAINQHHRLSKEHCADPATGGSCPPADRGLCPPAFSARADSGAELGLGRLANSSLDPDCLKSVIFPCVMKVGRTILALLIALSVAALPAAGGSAVAAKSTKMSDTAAMDGSDAAAMDDMDCCPHEPNPCDKAMDKSACMGTCALKCFTFGGSAVSIIIFPSHQARLSPALDTNPFNSQTGSPPFRPPRV